MSRHASAEDLACLDLGGLRRRKARRIQAHVTVCVKCTHLSKQLTSLSATLASVSHPAMPGHLSVRIEATIAAESAHRVASAPATEAGRGDLPERRRRTRQQRSGWQLPGMSVLGTRLVAAAGALVIVGVGGYEIASHAGGNVAGTAASSTGSATAPKAAAGPMSLGPSVQYGASSATKTVRTVTSDTNFTAASLGAQALVAVREARHRGDTGSQPTTGAAPSGHANSPASSAATSNAAGGGAASTSQLASCLDGIAGNRSVLLVEQAKYEGQPATIIVTAQTGTREAEVWAVGPSCTASHPDVLNHLRLSRT